MPTRLIRRFLLAASLSVLGACAVVLSGFVLNPSPIIAATGANRQSAPMELATTLLPVVLVHPEAEIPTLATVTVRPTRAESIDATPIAVASATSMPVLIRRPTSHLMSSAGFDMPYYSFGKTLRHVSKE